MRTIELRDGCAGLSPADLEGFFDGWPHPPGPAQHLRLLEGSYAVVIAWDGPRVVGFANAISDGVLAAYIPLLEVRPSHRGQGIGRALVRRLLDPLAHLYMVDLVCDPGLAPFYEPLGFTRLAGMARRNRDALKPR